jgi:hypothetical protein
MRFVFERGGRTGCRDPEALADYMDGAAFALSDLSVDLSETSWGGGPLVPFRTAQQIREDLAVWLRDCYGLNVTEATARLALAYWAEAMAIRPFVGPAVAPSNGKRL